MPEPEPLDLSESERSYLFGLRYDFAVYSTKFEAAQCFYDVRRLAEAQKAKLKGLGSVQFKKNHAVIRGNVIKSLTEAQYSQLLLPLAIEDPTISRLQHFVLGCYTLTPTLANRLTKCGLASSFSRLFRDAVDICSILPGTWEEVIAVLKQICEQNASDESTALSAAIEAALEVPPATSPAATSPDAPSEPATKRARFDIAVDGGKAGPLQFQPAWLDAAMNEDIDPNEIPDVEPRRMVMQMTDADTDRLQQLLQDSPLLDAIKTSRQWRWERKRDESSRPLRQRTNCIVALISGSSSHDISFVIKVGALAGWRINEYLEYDGSRNETLNET